MAADRAAKRARTKAEVAREEVAEPASPKVVRFAGVEFVLPDELPDVVLFDIAIMDSDEMAPLRLLDAILGREQYLTIRGLFARGVGEADLEGLVGEIAAAYGLTAGE